jgi:hypothetical protein
VVWLIRALGLALGVILAAVLAGCGNSAKTTTSPKPSQSTATSPTPGELTGFGATAAFWKASFRKSSASGSPCVSFGCYGPTIATPEGHVPQFTSVLRYGGRIEGFTYSMPAKTSEAKAKQQVRNLLPTDATVTTSGMIGTAPHNCFVWNLRSTKIAHALGSDGDTAGNIGVVFGTVGPGQGYVSYNPNNVNEALLTIAEHKLRGTCLALFEG